MKILFLCHRFPFPPDGGGKIRALHILRHLVASGHDVTLVSLVRTPAEAHGADVLRAEGVRVEAARVHNWKQSLRMLAYVPTAKPSSFAYFHSAELARRIERLLRDEPWDLIVVHCSSMAPYVAEVGHVPKIMDFADMDSQKWLDYSRVKRLPAAFVYALEGWKLRRQEHRFARSFDFCTVVSATELETLDAYGTGARADWFPNGVDLEYFSPRPGPYDPDLVVFVGRMDYYPNERAVRWFCRAVWPKLRERRRALKLRIIGANPPRAVRRLAAIDGVEVTGFVPDVRPHVLPAAVSVAPLGIARGMQNKVLECMAMGVPVIASEPVARGLGLGRDSPLRVASAAEDYVEAILAMVESPAERSRLASASRQLTEQRFSWRKAMQGLDEIMHAVSDDRRHRETSTNPRYSSELGDSHAADRRRVLRAR